MPKLFDAITCHEPRLLIKSVLWNALANLSNLLPFLCLAAIVDRIYGYYLTGRLDATALWREWALMLLCFVLTWALENVACKVTYRDGFMASADGCVWQNTFANCRWDSSTAATLAKSATR